MNWQLSTMKILSTPTANHALFCGEKTALKHIQFILLTVVTLAITTLGSAPIQAASTSTPPQTLFIAGDSTAANYDSQIQQGWAAELSAFFNSKQVKIDNRAVPGRSSRTFITQGHWQKLVNDLQPGDIVLIQFGHNDLSPVNDAHRARGTLPGIDRDTMPITNMLTQKKEVVYSYGHYIRKMVTDVKNKQATPILIGLTVRNIWKDSRIERNLGQYNAWSYQLSRDLNIPFIDLTNLIADKLEDLGPEKVARLYPKDHTHFNQGAASLYAQTVIGALKGLRPAIFDIADYSDSGKALSAENWTFVKLPVIANSNLPSIFLVGDSTVRNGVGDGKNGEWGWGDFLENYIDSDKVNVVNRAIGGFSSRSYINDGQWQKTLNMMRPGDTVIIQFGHNDSKSINDKVRPRGSLPGIGNETLNIVNQKTGQPESVHTYGWYLRKMIGEAKARGITPILCSPVPRKIWSKDGKHIVRPENSYQTWAKNVAKEADVQFIDLYELIARKYDKKGREKVNELFADKHTHTTQKGAKLNARVVAKHLAID
jgi:lysophospholipase L1-like esterase